MTDSADEVLKYNYGHVVVTQMLSEAPILSHLEATPEQRERWATERREREAADRPLLDEFLAELAALRAKYPDVKLYEDEYGGFEVVHGGARQWVKTDG